MIPEAAVEAALLGWDKVELRITRGRMREALEAAAPHMLADAWEAGRDAEFKRSVMKRPVDENPYRSTK